ncbi:MAG: hypothetical protein KDD37_01855 [Bdellovibrionales bacterium]|nr:hypothetical protein [Bdellovibrionales bacterium]
MTEKIFDSLEFTKNLENVGVPKKQAEKHVEIMGKIITKHLATKDDITIEILGVRHDIKLEMANLELNINKSLDRKIAIMLAVMTILLAIFKYA